MSASFVECYLAARLERYKKVGRKYHFRCPICGDGARQKSRRGGLYEHKQEWKFNCFNCGNSMSLRYFVSQYFPDLTPMLLIDNLMKPEYSQSEPEPIANPVQNQFIDASESFIAMAYLKSRGITDPTGIQYSSEPPAEIVGKSNPLREPCMVFPLKSIVDDSFSGYQLRCIGSNQLRYATFCIGKSYFGTRSEVPILVEGVFDALSIRNGLAILGASNSGFSGIWFLDQEPHNKEIVKMFAKLIKNGQTVALLPKDFRGSDANDMLKSGMSPTEIESLVRANSYSGAMAQLKLVEWQS